MRQCPKCEYIDPPYWKHVRWSYYIDACTFENFKIMKPELTKNLKGGDICEDDYFYYHLAVNELVVERKAKIDFCDSTNPFKVLTEKGQRTAHKMRAHDLRKHWARVHPTQHKLLEKPQDAET